MLTIFNQTLIRDDNFPAGRAAVDYYFIEEDGSLFKSTLLYEPYFYLACKVGMQCIAIDLIYADLTGRALQKGTESAVEEWLLKRFEDNIIRIERKRKEDLKMVSI